MMRKGDSLSVVDRKDGKLYDCKVVKRRNGRVLVHFIGWSKSHDEWLSIGDSRIKSPPSITNPIPTRAHSEDPDSLHVSRVSAEVVIDEAHDRLFSSQPPTHAQQMLRTPESSLTNRKRRRDPNSGGSSGNDRKRGAYADAARRGLMEGSLSPVHLPAPPSSAPMGDGTEQQRRPPATQPATTLDPPEAIGSSAGSGGVTDGGVSAVVPGGISMCGLCRLPTEQTKVECTDCRKSFHGDPLYLGVNPEVCAGLLADTDGAVLYRCCSCRLKHPNDAIGLSQLTRIVGELVKAVRSNKAHSPPVTSSAEVPRSTSNRDAILAQVREVQEREKRKDCIIIRGFRNMSVEVMRDQMAVICDLLNIPLVVMTEIQMVGDNYFRARVTDADSRRELLLRCHQLRNSEEFSRVYINRDLTFQQRQDLRNKRTVARESSSGVASGSNTVPVFQGNSNRAIFSGRFSHLEDESHEPNSTEPQSSGVTQGTLESGRPRRQSLSLQRNSNSTLGQRSGNGQGPGGSGSRGRGGAGRGARGTGRGRGGAGRGRGSNEGSNGAMNLGRGRGLGQDRVVRSEVDLNSRRGNNSQARTYSAAGQNSQDIYRNPVPSTSGIQFNNVPHQRRSLNN